MNVNMKKVNFIFCCIGKKRTFALEIITLLI